ncbi:uncharacterized protein BYT42DRAFT_625103 [Radiomyces spectabilis]|uniref:uncharacterized protein n=1 Tax=Radiomyces spectabilis TaxID=64574 RepID=UPI00221F49F1|nr:uncharacterized protein BYT42DRAFT_625103 [Radiomyces spectabilis]KAI8368299.1 hypothetical protein BYT42DRAFT_625103 [Radiomyces spectabilis]
MSQRENAFANHVLTSVKNDLSFLKDNCYITGEAYNEILKNLPTDLRTNNNVTSPAPQLPMRQMGGASPKKSYNEMSMPGTGNAPPPPAYNTAVNSPSLGMAEALYDYRAQNPEDLSITRGDIIQITEYVNDDWWRGSLQGRTGMFPKTYVQKLPNPPVDSKQPPPFPMTQPPAPMGPPPEANSYAGYASPPPPSTPASMPGGDTRGGYGVGSPYPPPPPANTPYNNYGPPPAAYQPPPTQPPPQSYAVPPPLATAASTSSAPAAVEHHEESKLGGFAKKFGSNVANAATWGFGATIGSEAAHAIF